MESLEQRLLPAAITVSTLDDVVDGGDGVISLREAILEANGNGEADTITFAAGLSGGTINLTGGQLSITDETTITGLGAANLTIDGQDTSRIFLIDTTLATAPVLISGLTLTNGRANSGGAILHNDGILGLLNCTITGNLATFDGGAIANRGIAMTIDGCTITNNDAFGNGGAIQTEGLLTILNSTISGNTAEDGGAIYAESGSDDIEVRDSTISNNYATYNGGGFFVGANLTILRSTISGNGTELDDGGGIYIYGSNLTVQDSTISANTTARDGAGIFVDEVNATILNSTISGNISSRHGAGIFNGGTDDDYDYSMTITNCTISGNNGQSSGSRGGAIYSENLLVVQNTTISGNTQGTGRAQVEFNEADGFPEVTIIRNTIIANGTIDLRFEAAGTTVGTLTLLFNLVEMHDVNLASPNVTASTNLFDTDPILGPLQDNGGLTFTHALLTGSPAIDTGDDSLLPDDEFDLDGDTILVEDLPFDQRGTGFPRVSGAAVDIGAIEVQALSAGRLAFGSDVGRTSQPVVRVYDEAAFTGGGTPTPLFEISATDTYGATYRGGVRVATGDVNGDGIADIVTAPGRNKAPDIKIFNGVDGTLLGTIAATATYGANFKNGVYVAVGDVTGDGVADIVISQELGSPTVIVFRNLDPAVGVGFAEYNRTRVFADFRKFIGGATVAVGDVAGSTNGEIIVGSGPGMRTVVRVFSVTPTSATAGTLTTLRNINPPAQFGNRFNHGVYVSVGDVVGSDGKLEILTGAGSGSLATGAGSTIRIYNGATGELLNSFQSFGTRAAVSNSPVRVAVRNGTIFAVQSQDGRSQYQVRRFNLTEEDGFFSVAATDPSDPRFFGGGLFIG